MTNSQREIQKSMAQLASGNRITKSADDAAGLAISENLKNLQSEAMLKPIEMRMMSISLIQTAEGGLGEISNILTRMRELGIQASSDTVSDKERLMVDHEVQQLKAEVQRIAVTTKFGNQHLIDGSGSQFDFQGRNRKWSWCGQNLFWFRRHQCDGFSFDISDFDFTSKAGAQDALSVLDSSQSEVNGFL